MNSKHYKAHRFVELREAKRATQQAVAEQLGVDRQTIYRIEAGSGGSYELIAQLCAFYGVSTHEVLLPFPALEPELVTA